MTLSFNPSFRQFCKVQIVLVSAIIILGAAAYVFTNVTGHGRLFGFLSLLDVDHEQSLPTYFSTLNLLLASLLLFVIYSYEKSSRNRGSRYWGLMALLFLFLSFDEAAGIHEKFGNIYIFLVDKNVIPPQLDAHEWLPFGILFVVIAAVVFYPFVRDLRSDTRRNFVIAGCVFVGGAVGIEIIQSAMFEYGMINGDSIAPRQLGPLVEEGFEMAGIAIFNCALYREIMRRNISLLIGDSAESGS